MSLNFMKYKFIYLILSLIVIIPGLFSLLRFGLKPSIDFTGGTLWEISFDSTQVNSDQLRQSLGDKASLVGSIQETDTSFILQAKPLTESEHQELKSNLQNLGQVNEIRFETVGPTLGQELLKKTIVAVVIASSVILLFVAWSFKNIKFGLAATLATFHDTLVILGIFSLLGHFQGIEVDTLFVTAVLTILSFSVHDTIVVFDRIRETRRLHPQADFEAIVNKSVAETLGRSVNNSMTIIFMLLSLYLLGGETIKNFILALLIGTISGTYSSTFTAAPLLVIWKNIKNRKK